MQVFASSMQWERPALLPSEVNLRTDLSRYAKSVAKPLRGRIFVPAGILSDQFVYSISCCRAEQSAAPAPHSRAQLILELIVRFLRAVIIPIPTPAVQYINIRDKQLPQILHGILRRVNHCEKNVPIGTPLLMAIENRQNFLKISVKKSSQLSRSCTPKLTGCLYFIFLVYNKKVIVSVIVH